MSPAGFEPEIPASERSQAHALDCAATGIGSRLRKVSPTGIRSRTFRPVDSRYTDWAIPAHGMKTAELTICAIMDSIH